MDGPIPIFGREPGQIVIRVEADIARHARSDDEVMRNGATAVQHEMGVSILGLEPYAHPFRQPTFSAVCP